MSELLDQLRLTDADDVCRVLDEGAAANLKSPCRAGSIDHVRGPGHLIATGDLHDNPVHFTRVCELAELEADPTGPHVTLHELIHSDRLINDMDLSYRVLVKIAALKAARPERIHTLLANHELAQIAGSGIVKDGLNVVKAFNDGVDYVFGSGYERVTASLNGFIRSMPLALRCTPTDPSRGDILCAHSLPPADLMERFDPGVLERPLTEDDYAPRRGSAHILVWGRSHDTDLIEQLAARWGVGLFILGHEKAPEGFLARGERAVILNSDHERGAYLNVPLSGAAPAPADLRPIRLVSGM
ncbi:MAG: hypothetical protein ACREJO_13115 [Phycisphaerales bacterium]